MAENQDISVNKKEMKEKKPIFIKPFMKMHKIPLLYYILSFVVLFFKIFILKSDNLSGTTYRVGYQEFAFGVGWVYYLANIIGLLTVISPILKFLQGIGTKIISVVNLSISSYLLFKTIPDAIRPSQSIVSFIGKGELATGFYLILGLHTLAVLLFWFSFIRRISNKRKSKQVQSNEVLMEEDIYEGK